MTQAKSKRIRLTESAVEMTARLLSKQYGIKVVWKTGKCETTGNTIYLPTLPNDATDELLQAVHGFLDHETARVLFTDFLKIHGKRPGTQQHCVALVEDIRINEKICGIFPGSKSNLESSNQWILPQVAKNWENINAFKRVCTAYSQLTEYGEDEFWDNTVDQETKDLVKSCTEAVGNLDNVHTTQDAVDAGLRMYEVIKHLAPEEEEEQQEQAQQAQGSAGKGKQPVQPATGTQDLGGMLAQQTSDLLAQQASEQRKAGPRSGYEHNLEHDHSYVIYSTEGDTVQSFPDATITTNGSDLKHFRDGTREITSVIRIRLVNSLRATARRRWVGGKEEGKLDTRRMYKAVIGTSNDVYKQQTDKAALNTAIVMAIDHSGSMHGTKLELAGRSAIVIGDALNVLRVPFAVYGYSTEHCIVPPPDVSPYARYNSLWIRYYRDFAESWERGALRLSSAANNCQQNTLDAESVKHGVRRLLARPEKRKILFVLNDGQPCPGAGHIGRCQQHLHDVVASARSVGVEVVAFGIQDPNVATYYPNHVIINDIQDLAKEPLKMLDSMLRKGVTKV